MCTDLFLFSNLCLSADKEMMINDTMAHKSMKKLREIIFIDIFFRSDKQQEFARL
jgi:hypothetical protein